MNPVPQSTRIVGCQNRCLELPGRKGVCPTTQETGKPGLPAPLNLNYKSRMMSFVCSCLSVYQTLSSGKPSLFCFRSKSPASPSSKAHSLAKMHFASLALIFLSGSVTMAYEPCKSPAKPNCCTVSTNALGKLIDTGCVPGERISPLDRHVCRYLAEQQLTILSRYRDFYP